MDEAKRKQVADQCKAVAHMATALAQVYGDYAKMFEEDVPAMADIADSIGKRTAGLMETLGDILNGMDAVTEDDEWVSPVMREAQRLWPNPNQ